MTYSPYRKDWNKALEIADKLNCLIAANDYRLKHPQYCGKKEAETMLEETRTLWMIYEDIAEGLGITIEQLNYHVITSTFLGATKIRVDNREGDLSDILTRESENAPRQCIMKVYDDGVDFKKIEENPKDKPKK